MTVAFHYYRKVLCRNCTERPKRDAQYSLDIVAEEFGSTEATLIAYRQYLQAFITTQKCTSENATEGPLGIQIARLDLRSK